MDNAVEFKVRIRDIAVGIITCLLFGTLVFYTGQNPVVSTLASVTLGYTAAVASIHLWSPWVKAD